MRYRKNVPVHCLLNSLGRAVLRDQGRLQETANHTSPSRTLHHFHRMRLVDSRARHEAEFNLVFPSAGVMEPTLPNARSVSLTVSCSGSRQHLHGSRCLSAHRHPEARIFSNHAFREGCPPPCSKVSSEYGELKNYPIENLNISCN